ncbi:MAG: MFS transporter [Chloroflexi bacterium]|nr:MAG: MFS transporter [Chloroflexota bacterium]TMC29657.1 MAG: MFS transporter [Chloroflexota bacterium]TMC32909.1 MAG: MFS transporter [Chloroflexota bacterium]TMC58493.1 MAG: MFS transporter [Chloroflexota bacterium]TME36772.1 MAG: MFS transporter [Chloroflexota bacterium]
MTAAVAPRREAFAALRHADFRVYFVLGLVAMMADNVEHVITYWLIFERFHSAALAGFAVISHWAPFLLFGITFGALADRFDCRRIIQAGQGLFILASFSWAALFLTNTLEAWHAVILLIVHGLAGALWSPASQLFLYDVVGRDELQSAVRLNATSRNLGILFGPSVGSGLLIALGPANGLLVNCLLYVPLIAWLFITRYTGHMHHGAGRVPQAISLADAWQTLKDVSRQPVILSMVVLAGATSFLVGNAYQAQMPAFSADIPGAQGEVGYGVLLTASAAGAVAAGFSLEWSTWLRRASVLPALAMGVAWALAIAVFAFTRSYVLAVVALFIAGFLNLAFSSLAQTIVQLEAPPDRRGRVVGLFSMSQNGLRVGSGLVVGVVGAAVGIHASLGYAALVSLAICAALLLLARSPRVAFG